MFFIHKIKATKFNELDVWEFNTKIVLFSGGGKDFPMCLRSAIRVVNQRGPCLLRGVSVKLSVNVLNRKFISFCHSFLGDLPFLWLRGW